MGGACSQKKQKLVKASSTEKESKRRVLIKKESLSLDDAAAEKPQSESAARKPQPSPKQKPKQKQGLQDADSAADDSAPVITG